MSPFYHATVGPTSDVDGDSGLPERDRGEFDDAILAISMFYGGKMFRRQCFYTGQRVIGLSFKSEKQRELACDRIAKLFPAVEWPKQDSCGNCPFVRLCPDNVRAACPWN